MKTVRDYDELRHIKGELDEAAANGSLTPELLGEAVETEDSAGYETIPCSVGMSWLWHNAAVFAENIDDALGFFQAHMDNPYIGGVLSQAELLQLIPETDREDFVREVFERHGGRIEGIIEAGVPRAVVAELILAQLRRTPVDPYSTSADFVRHDFLSWGFRLEYNRDTETWHFREDEVTLWSILDDGQLVEAAHICIAKAPHMLFWGTDVNRRITLADTFGLRLGAEKVNELLLEAASNLPSMHDVSIQVIDRLAVKDQLTLARRLDGGSLDLVVHLALKLGYDGGGKELIEEFDAQFRSGHSAANYRRLWSKLRSGCVDNQAMADTIEYRLRRQLDYDGYQLGQVVEGKYFDRREQRQKRQMRVDGENVTYVQDRYQHRYFAKEGDWVLFKPSEGRRLTPKVISVIFIPAHSTKEYA